MAEAYVPAALTAAQHVEDVALLALAVVALKKTMIFTKKLVLLW